MERTPVARRIRQLLEERGWSVLELSRQLENAAGGKSATWNTQVSRWLHTDRLPERRGAEALAAAFGAAVDEFEIARSLTEADARRLRDELEAFKERAEVRSAKRAADDLEALAQATEAARAMARTSAQSPDGYVQERRKAG